LIDDIEEKRRFRDMMNTVSLLYSKQNFTPEALRVWFFKLQEYEFNIVSKSFDEWVNKNQYMPTVFDIVSLCKSHSPKPYIKMLPRNITPYQIEHNKEKAKEMLSKVVLKPTDPKAWAKKILEQESKGEYRLEIGIKFAREALKLK